MANRNTLSASAPAANKMRAMQEADVQQQMINEKVKRLGLPQPDYQFKELIGKGSYGRVYKRYVSIHQYPCRPRRLWKFVAVKIATYANDTPIQSES